MVTTELIQARLNELETVLRDQYKPQNPPKKRDWRTYEEEWANRIRLVMRNLEPLVDKACEFVSVPGPGAPHLLTVKQRVVLLLLKTLYEQSNRRMSGMLVAFSLLSGLDVSYKTVERLYSDPEVEIALWNLHQLMLQQRGIKNTDASGDGTGYALSITQHYASTANRHKEKSKENPPAEKSQDNMESKRSSPKKIKRFVYAFRIMDLRTHLYIATGTSMKGERLAYESALNCLKNTGIKVVSIRLDRYFSYPKDAARFKGAKVYLIPRKNMSPHLPIQREWLEGMEMFVEETLEYLKQYYLRGHSEAGFSADKRILGWGISQRRDDRINTAQTCQSTWHNLLNLYGPDYPLPMAGLSR
jgi:transposase